MGLFTNEYQALFRVYMTLPSSAYLTYDGVEIAEFHQNIGAIELLSGRVLRIRDIDTNKLSLGFDRELILPEEAHGMHATNIYPLHP
ncbi:hypothetical protein Q4520_18275 [Alteromonas sp. 1_MG-2023]|uniref:hypothetical protein n=1 Tax=Alteromonas sp. 1_MG-2023 TaxID=3062669 RepID=UPI0026E3A316|nr:hypothetical protein [Alteromonas sp. 1_MG-2023]MDO6477372.1 hypothetical protein [Alteromonas sp. 1_MG-2023]